MRGATSAIWVASSPMAGVGPAGAFSAVTVDAAAARRRELP
ncbi:hypothetical protein SLI_5392 [Streptomyces lividans 1326]|uniref:Uncharacterized protein n=1 Tax=Streptomyces lividans 1326 TaxID=1200984 RepID=A0A7U9DVQ1_STRLI|nr:hypothetical protein SLI_5392 [Streptomyces lividans 1326]